MLDTTTTASATEDVEAQELLAKWDAENCGAVSDDEDDADEDVLDMDDLYRKYRRSNVTVTDRAVDHIILGTSDLQKAMDDMEAWTGGLRPLGITSVNGLGTACARMAFCNPTHGDNDETCTYLEIMGPDPKQASTDLADKLSQLEPGQLVPVHYAIRSTAALAKVTDQSIPYDKITLVETDNGAPVLYDYYILEEHEQGGLVPNLVSWPEPKDGDDDDDVCHHQAARLPVLGTLDQIRVTLPTSTSSPPPAHHAVLDEACETIAAVEVGLAGDDETGDQGTLTFTMTTTEGKELTFSTAGPMGFSFPKQGGLEVKKPDFA